MELDRFPPNDTEKLLAFNITKKRIANLCNKNFEDDPFDKAKNYSSWHRAMDGNEVWEVMVRELEGLYELQTKYPKRYLPSDPPEQDLHTWMKAIASADWWLEVLKPEASPSAFRAWFSNRPMGKKKIEDVRARVDEWWAHLQEQVALARRYTFVEQRRQDSWKEQFRGNNIETWDTWCKDRLEKGMTVDQVREAMVEEAMLLDRYYVQLLDLANPQALKPGNHKQSYLGLQERCARQQFDELLEAGFPLAVSRTPPDFDPGPIVTERQWGDRRDERCMKDLNVPLYNKWYREHTHHRWNPEIRQVESEYEIAQVSVDRKVWREPNETEKKGWDSGDYWFAYAFKYDGGDMRNSYRRERDELLEKRSVARSNYEYSGPGSALEARAKAELERIERQIDTLHLRE